MFRDDRCYNGGNRHKFSARYSEEPSGYNVKCANVYGDSENLKKLMYIKVYQRDVCEWCGKVVEMGK